MNVLEKLHLLFRTINMNDDDNEAKVCGISTNFIRKLTDLFYVTVCEKASKHITLNKTYYLRKIPKIARIYGPMYL